MTVLLHLRLLLMMVENQPQKENWVGSSIQPARSKQQQCRHTRKISLRKMSERRGPRRQRASRDVGTTISTGWLGLKRLPAVLVDFVMDESITVDVWPSPVD